jgi:hypothetical protein
MNGFRKIFPSFLSHYATFFAKMAERKIVPFDEFYYQLKLMHLFQIHPVYFIFFFYKYSFQVSLIASAAFSPIMTAGALVCAPIANGMTLESATLNLPTP